MAVAYPNVRKKSDELREQILVLTRRDDLFIRGLMVFPKACLEARAETRNIHCLNVEKVYDYFDKCPKSLQPNEVERIARAVTCVADMSSERPEAPTASPIQTSLIASHLGAIGKGLNVDAKKHPGPAVT